MTSEEYSRYDRHIRLNEIGEKGQIKLTSAKVLVIGAGGLGAPILQYLAAAGVGHIGIVDDDSVEFSNLQRQVLFTENEVGHKKTSAAKRRLQASNSLIKITEFSERLDYTNALKIITPFDIVIDGTDNFPTRYLVSDACVILKKPLVFGSILKFEGQVSVFNYDNGPSYRCLFPEPPKVGTVPSCSEVGVLGVLPAVIGSIMATECLKLILEIGEVLSGKLMVMNLLTHANHELQIPRIEENFKRTELEDDYMSFCGLTIPDVSSSISAFHLRDMLKNSSKISLIDVREPHEFEAGHLPKSINLPLSELHKTNGIAHLLDRNSLEEEIIIYCQSGMRSTQAAIIISESISRKCINLSGGLNAYDKLI